VHKATRADRTAPKGIPSEFQTFACPCYDWVGAWQTLAAGQNADSFAANCNVDNTYLKSTDYHTLCQLYVRNSATGDGVEFGITHDVGLFGDSQPRLFAGYRKGTVWQGYGTNFVDYAPNVSYTYGSVVPTGTVKRIQIKQSGGAWWLAYDGAWIGYFLNTNFSPNTFTTFDFVDGFYEVASSVAESCSDMGNGKLSSDSTSARIDSASITGGTSPTTNVVLHDAPTGHIGYSGTQVTAFTVRAGGPGANAAGNAVGITGGC
jgi:hypothetical protein